MKICGKIKLGNKGIPKRRIPCVWPKLAIHLVACAYPTKEVAQVAQFWTLLVFKFPHIIYRGVGRRSRVRLDNFSLAYY